LVEILLALITWDRVSDFPPPGVGAVNARP
jgi:hypothetical protein